MRVIDGIKYYNMSEIGEIIDVDNKDIYYIVRKDKEWSKNSMFQVLPEPITVGRTPYYSSNDIEIFRAIFNEVENGSFKSAYEKIKEKMILQQMKNNTFNNNE